MIYIQVDISEKYGDLLPIGDLHFADKAFRDQSYHKLFGYRDWVIEHPNSRVFLGGDIFNVATRASKTSPFEQRMTFNEEMEEIVKILTPIKKQIIGAIDGNHENRVMDYMGMSPTQLLCAKLDIKYMGISGVVNFRVGKRRTSLGGKPLWRQNYNVYFHHCFDEETEILTENGWQKYNKLVKNEKVMTMNLKNGNAEWDRIKDIYIYDDFKKMVSFKTKTSDLLVSEDHTLIGKKRSNGCLFRKYANEFLGKDNSFPATLNNNQKDYPINDNLLRLLGWVLTEGTTFKGKKHEVRITQSDKPKVGLLYIENIIRSLGSPYNVRQKYAKGFDGKINRNYDAYEIYINKGELSKKIRELIPEKKIPNWFFQLSKRQFDLLFHEMILGDGTFDKRIGCHNFSYSQKDKNEIDKLQALCVINGWRTVMSKKQPWGGYRLSITDNDFHRVKKEAGMIKKYSGKAWCVSVENQTLMVRRNGRITITGNTTGGGQTLGGGLNRVEKLSNIMEDIDCYCGFHNHKLSVAKATIYRPSQASGRIEERTVTYVTCGGYLQYDESYAERGMLRPSKLGSPRIRLFGDNKKDTHISI